MVSLDGDQQHNLYVNPQGAYGSDQQWYGDLGLGYRWIKNDAAILGWYLFAGHSRVENSSGFWITNPGLEVMGSRWDARINAYIPVAGRSNEVGNVDFNIVSEPFFTGHTEVIVSEFNVGNAIQQIGNGADARVGYQFFHQVPLKGYIGAYFFDIANTDNVRGGAAGLEYWFDDNIRVFANYSYDNYQHSKVVGGLGISFGGVRKHWADPSLSERLTDPVERYLANLGHGSGIPSKTLLYGIGPGSSTEFITNNIAFFTQTGTPNAGGVGLTIANCTFENPCGPTDFTQTGVTSLGNFLPNTQIYFNGGTYTTNGVVNLVPGQTVESRSVDFSQPASGANRSTIITPTIGLQGNNSLTNIILSPSANNTTTGVTISGAGNDIINTQIGSSTNLFKDGVEDMGSNTFMDNSNVFALDTAYEAVGSTTTIQNSAFDTETSIGAGFGLGIVGNNGAQIAVNNSQIIVNSTGTAGATGIALTAGSAIDVNSTVVAVTTNTGNSYALANLSSEIFVSGGTLAARSSGSNVAILNPISTGISTIGGLTVCQVNNAIVPCP